MGALLQTASAFRIRICILGADPYSVSVFRIRIYILGADPYSVFVFRIRICIWAQIHIPYLYSVSVFRILGAAPYSIPYPYSVSVGISVNEMAKPTLGLANGPRRVVPRAANAASATGSTQPTSVRGSGRRMAPPDHSAAIPTPFLCHRISDRRCCPTRRQSRFVVKWSSSLTMDRACTTHCDVAKFLWAGQAVRRKPYGKSLLCIMSRRTRYSCCSGKTLDEWLVHERGVNVTMDEYTRRQAKCGWGGSLEILS